MHLQSCRWTVAFSILVLVGCGDDGPMQPPVPAAIAMVSGDNQAAKAGQELAQPFVVRVTDARGRGLGNVQVTWTVTSGEGAFDGHFENMECPPVPTTSMRTDPDGFAQVSFMPTWFGPSTMTAEVAGLRGSSVTFMADATDPRAVLSIVSGNNQKGKAGEMLGELLWVRVTDGEGNLVPHVTVTWAVTSGGGRFPGGCTRGNPATATTRTLPEGVGIGSRSGPGLAWVHFQPTMVGISTVAAAVPGVRVSPVTFTVDATVMVITLTYDPGIDKIAFFGPDFSSDITVPIGATVEWVNDLPMAHITSTSVPAGGASFDSGELSQGERFQFVPEVAGTWEFVDLVSGSTGTLTAH